MDASLVKAGAAAAIGLVLLIPAFNGLSLSYVEDVPPPSWIPPPDKPPTPPPDWQPPPDWKPPPEWEGDYDFPVPPMCPPPVQRDLNITAPDGRSSPQASFALTSGMSDTLTFTMQVPNYTFVVGGYVNLSAGWQSGGPDVRIRIDGAGEHTTTYTAVNNLTTVSLVPRSNNAASFSFRSDEEWDANAPPPWGEYTITITAPFPIDVRGTLRFAAGVACGGLLE